MITFVSPTRSFLVAGLRNFCTENHSTAIYVTVVYIRGRTRRCPQNYWYFCSYKYYYRGSTRCDRFVQLPVEPGTASTTYHCWNVSIRAGNSYEAQGTTGRGYQRAVDTCTVVGDDSTLNIRGTECTWGYRPMKN